MGGLPTIRATEFGPEEIGFLEDRLYAFNRDATGIADGRSLGFAARDASGALVAGAAGHSWGGTCELRQVWVRESLRGRGLGKRLLAAVEAEARRRGCRQLVLSTHSFQAPGFYLGRGFEVIGEIPDYPRGHSQVLLRKALTDAS